MGARAVGDGLSWYDDLQRLVEARGIAGFLLGEAASKLGMSVGLLEDMEWGRLPITWSWGLRLAEAYGVRVEWLRGERTSLAGIERRHGIVRGELEKLGYEERVRLLRNLDAVGVVVGGLDV